MLRRTRSVLATVMGVAVAIAVGTAAHAAPVAKLKQFKVPTIGSSPMQIIEATDGNFWFTESFLNDQNASGHKVARVTPSGAVAEYLVCEFCFPSDIVQGQDSLLYFSSNDGLGRIGTNGDVLSFVNAPFSVGGNHLAVDGDDVWITDFNGRSLWRFDTPTGGFTEFPIGDGGLFGPHDVAVAANGDIWFAGSDISGPVEQGLLGRLNPSTGMITTVNVDAVPRSITVAIDASVWFTARFTPQAVGRLDPSTGTATVFPVDGGPQDIAASPDGSVWFTRTTAGRITQMSEGGLITSESKAVKGSEPFGITVSGSGDPWFAMLSADKIATLDLP